MAKPPQWNYHTEARKGRTPIVGKSGRTKTSIVGKHATQGRAKIGQIVSDYETGRKLPPKYASPKMIRQHGINARVPVAEAVDYEARPIMLPYEGRRAQPRSRVRGRAAEEVQQKGITRLRTPAQIAASRRNLIIARAFR